MSKQKLLILKGNYVHISHNDWVFHRDKIISVVLRPAIFHWKWPYIMEVAYAKKWSESYMVGGTMFFPITEHHDIKQYKMKLLDEEKLFEWQKEWKKIDIPVINKVS